MAADDINAQGGVDGRKIQVITYDDHSSAADGVRAFQRAVNQDKVVAVIGSYISEVALQRLVSSCVMGAADSLYPAFCGYSVPEAHVTQSA